MDSAPSVDSRDGLQGLLRAVGHVHDVELVRWDRDGAREAVPSAARQRLLRLIRTARPDDARSVTHPPWPASLLVHTRAHGDYAITLVGDRRLRLDPGNLARRFTGPSAVWNDAPPEMEVYDPDNWLWQYLEARLGKTLAKEYQTPPCPNFPIEPP